MQTRCPLTLCIHEVACLASCPCAIEPCVLIAYVCIVLHQLCTVVRPASEWDEVIICIVTIVRDVLRLKQARVKAAGYGHSQVSMIRFIDCMAYEYAI